MTVSEQIKCACGHLAEDHCATCLPPFDAAGQQCHAHDSPLPCLGEHCSWMGCTCTSPSSRPDDVWIDRIGWVSKQFADELPMITASLLSGPIESNEQKESKR